MVDIQLLEKEYGLNQEYFAKALGGDLSKKKSDAKTYSPATSEPAPPDTNLEARSAMQRRIKNRIDEGMKRNFENYRTNYALDLAWDIPFKQTTPTLLQTLIDKDPEGQQVKDAVSGWGLNELLVDAEDPKTGMKTGKKVLNLPIFHNIYVPLVRAYVTIRWAKIVNDRRLKPFFKFEPAKLTMENKTKCEVITDRIEVMNTQFNYFETMKQGVLKMLHYGKCMQFIREEWYREEQEHYVPKMVEQLITVETEAGPQQVKQMVQEEKDGKPVFTVERKTVCEGLRYEHPHPSRTYRDLAHPAYTLNTNTGAEFAGYWKIIRAREILNNPAFYGRGDIPLGEKDPRTEHSLFFQTAYSACTLSCPVATTGAEGGVGEQDAQKKVASIWYGSEHNDQGIVVTQHFEKINPRRDGLVNTGSKKGSVGYDGEVWFRFLIAGTSGNIIYAAPLPDTPVTYAGYDADESRDQNPSMSLEILPFQDQFGNVLSQMLLSMKQNLANLTFIDQDQVPESSIDKIRGMGERFYRSINILGFSSMKAKKAQHQVPDAVTSFKFPQMNTGEMMGALKVILDTLERILVMSSQEVGQAASHEQTREEIKNLATTSSSRLVFTTTPIDSQRDAWKRQLYAYDMSYGESEFYAQIPCDRSIDKAELEAMGFTYDDKAHHGDDKFLTVKANRRATAIPLHQFSNTRDGEDRSSDSQMAQILATLVRDVLANPMTAQAIGPEQAIALTNVIAQYAGVPRDFKIRSLIKDGDMGKGGGGGEEMAKAMAAMQQQSIEQLKEVAQEVIEKCSQKTDKAVQRAEQQTNNAVMSLEQEVSKAVGASKSIEIQLAGVLRVLEQAEKIKSQKKPSDD